MPVREILREHHVGGLLGPQSGLLVAVRLVAADPHVMERLREVGFLCVDLQAVAAVARHLVVPLESSLAFACVLST